jgi:hypothetical protein
MNQAPIPRRATRTTAFRVAYLLYARAGYENAEIRRNEPAAQPSNFSHNLSYQTVPLNDRRLKAGGLGLRLKVA